MNTTAEQDIVSILLNNGHQESYIFVNSWNEHNLPNALLVEHHKIFVSPCMMKNFIDVIKKDVAAKIKEGRIQVILIT